MLKLIIGQKVLVGSKQIPMYVRELHNPNLVGLSHSIDSNHIYGILYEKINIFNK